MVLIAIVSVWLWLCRDSASVGPQRRQQILCPDHRRRAVNIPVHNGAHLQRTHRLVQSQSMHAHNRTDLRIINLKRRQIGNALRHHRSEHLRTRNVRHLRLDILGDLRLSVLSDVRLLSGHHRLLVRLMFLELRHNDGAVEPRLLSAAAVAVQSSRRNWAVML